MTRFLTALLLAAFALAAQAAVDANKASQPELETVKGIGPGLSGKILTARKSGDFKDWNDLVDRVGGIGAGNAGRFSQAGLTVGGAAFDSQSVGAAKPAKSAKADKAGKADKSEKAARASRKAAAAEGSR